MDLYLDNSNVIELRSLTNSVTGVVDTGATVTVTIKDAAGTNVTGQTWPAAMSHASAGTYRATLDAAMSIEAGRRYVVIVNATGSGGEVGEWNCKVIAVDRFCT
jgi:hypothetical protein